MMPTTILDVLSSLRKTLDELKGRQVLGASSIKVRANQSAAAYDYTATTAYPSSAIFTVTFTADHQDYAPTDLVPQLSVGTPGHLAALGVDYFPGSFYRLSQDPAHPRITQWRMQVFNFTGTPLTFYLKVRVNSTDTGVIS